MKRCEQGRWLLVYSSKTTIEEVVRVTQTDEVMAETPKKPKAGRGGIGKRAPNPIAPFAADPFA